MYTDKRGQIVFVDTPGIHKAKNKLGEYMVGAAEKTISEVDLICWLVELQHILELPRSISLRSLKSVRLL